MTAARTPDTSRRLKPPASLVVPVPPGAVDALALGPPGPVVAGISDVETGVGVGNTASPGARYIGLPTPPPVGSNGIHP